MWGSIKIMDNYTPLNSLMHDHMLDLQSQFERAHRNTRTEECNNLARDIALISIAQSLNSIEQLLTRWAPNGIINSNDREEDMQS